MLTNTKLRKIVATCLRKPAIFSLILCLGAVFSILGTIPQAQALVSCHGDPIVRTRR